MRFGSASTAQRRGIPLVAIGALLAGVTAPRLLFLAAVGLVAGAALWLVIDLASAIRPIGWTDHRNAGDRGGAPDRRVETLRTRLTGPRTRIPWLTLAPQNEEADKGNGTDDRALAGRRDDDASIAATLVDLIDDHLRAEHGIDRATDPVAAAAVLGPELSRFVTDPAARLSMTKRRSMSSTLTMIEAL